MNLLPVLIIMPMATALLILAARSLPKAWHDAAAFLAVTGGALLSFVVQKQILAEGLLLFNPGAVVPGLGTICAADGLTGFMLITVNTVIAIITVYAISFTDRLDDAYLYHVLMLMLTAGLNGVLIAGDVFTLYVFMEIAVMSAYLLTSLNNEPASIEASFKYAIMGGISSLMILSAGAILYTGSGTLSFPGLALSWQHPDHLVAVLVMVLLVVGFGLKATLIPFSSWVPDAYCAAPAPVSAMFSGAVCKVVGIYALMRLMYSVFGCDPRVMTLLAWCALASILIGVTLALYQWNIKRLLAYHSISQIGYIMLGLSLGTPLGVAGGLLHLANHSVFKPLLFLNAGSIERATGAESLKDTGGLSVRMPVTGVTSLIASLSISGIPPFNGFWSKLMVILACIQVGKNGYAIVAVVGSILTLASFMKLQRYAFRGPLTQALHAAAEAPLLMRIAMILLAALCISMGILLLPGINEVFLEPAVNALMAGKHYVVEIERLMQ